MAMIEFKQALFFLIFIEFLFAFNTIRQLIDNNESLIDENSSISFIQTEQQKTFVYSVKYQNYIMITLSLQSQDIQNSSNKIQICSAKNRSIQLIDDDTSQQVNVIADKCDILSYQQNSMNLYLFYLPQQLTVGDQIYISIIMSKQLKKSSSSQMCPQQCSNQGNCLNTCECQCFDGYIKNDCSIQAASLKLNSIWKGMLQYQQAQYLIINFNDSSFDGLQNSMVQINFIKASNFQNRLLDTSPLIGSEYLIISYLFVSKLRNQLPSQTNSDSTYYMNANQYTLNFFSSQIQSMGDKSHMVISIYSNYTSNSYFSVEVSYDQGLGDDSLKTKIFIIFFSCFGFIVLLWILMLVYRAYKRRQLERSRLQQALESIVNRRTNRVSPSKLSLSSDMVDKYMPIRIYKDILERLKKPYKNLACELLLAQQLLKTYQKEQMESQKFGKQISEKTFCQQNQLNNELEKVDLSTLQNKRTNNDISIINENQQDQTNALINQQNLVENENNLQDQNEINLFRNNSNNFEISVQFNQANIESFQDEDEIQYDNLEDGGMSKDVEGTQNQENQQKVQNPIQEEQCSVCLIEFKDEDKIRITICDHIFHSECLLQWLKSQENCPNCRKDLQRRKLKYWYSVNIRKQMKVILKDRSAFSLNLFLGQSKCKSTNFEDQVNNRTDQDQNSNKKMQMFSFNKAKSLSRFNSLQGDLNNNQQIQGNTENIIQNRQTENFQQNNQIKQGIHKSNQKPAQAEYQEIQFNGAVVRIAIAKPKIETTTSKVIEDENEEEEEKKEQQEIIETQPLNINQSKQIAQQNSHFMNESLSIQKENKCNLDYNFSNQDIDFLQVDQAQNQNVFENISLNNSIQIEDSQRENTQNFRKRKALKESWFKKTQDSKQNLSVQQDNQSIKNTLSDKDVEDQKEIKENSIKQENSKQNYCIDHQIIIDDERQVLNKIKTQVSIQKEEHHTLSEFINKNKINLSTISLNKSKDLNQSIHENSKTMNIENNKLGQQKEQNEEIFSCVLIDLENRQDSPNKIDQIIQKIELNIDFDPSIFRLQTEDQKKQNESKQVNKQKEKSNTVMRNNKKIIQQDKTPNARTKQFNLNSSSIKDTSSKQFISPQQNNSSHHQIQKYPLISSPILQQNASSILNNKKNIQRGTWISPQEINNQQKSQIRNSQEKKQ